MILMPKPLRTEEAALVALCVSWLVEEGVITAERTRIKLAVPHRNLWSAMASLTSEELRELQADITRVAARGRLPGPFPADRLCAALASVAVSSPPGSKSHRRAAPADPGRAAPAEERREFL